MRDVQAKVVSRRLEIVMEKAMAGNEIAGEVSRLLTGLGQELNYKGKIIGHLKAIVEAGDKFVQLSLTNMPDITVKASSDWYDNSFEQFSLTVNIIVFGHEKNRLEVILQEGLKSLAFNLQ